MIANTSLISTIWFGASPFRNGWMSDTDVRVALHRGMAQPGTLDATNGWRIEEIIFVGPDEDVEIRWAGGDANFDKVWDDRATFLYS